jgi:hypothetical protein
MDAPIPPKPPDGDRIMIVSSLTAAVLAILMAAPIAMTPPKPTIQDQGSGRKTTDQTERAREDVKSGNARVLRGGVPEDTWLEALHRLKRVPSPRRENATRLVRSYIAASEVWRTNEAPELKRLTEFLVTARNSGQEPPVEIVVKVREIRAAMPRLARLQEQVWEVLSGPERSRLTDEVVELKKNGLPEDVREGRRKPGTLAAEPPKPIEGGDATATPTDQPVPALWSFIDDPNAGKPLPEPPSDSESKSGSPLSPPKSR